VATSTTNTDPANKPKNKTQPKKQTPKEVVHTKPPTTTNKQKTKQQSTHSRNAQTAAKKTQFTRNQPPTSYITLRLGQQKVY
jgi:hypothetical protein